MTQTNEHGPGAQGAPTGKNLMQVLRETAPIALAELPVVQERFVALMERTRGVDKNMAQMVFEQERYHFLRQISNSPELRKCETMSLYGCFMDCAVNGLSFDPSKKLAYLIPSNVNVGTKDQPIWTKRASLEASPYGELAIRQRHRQIRYADNPVIVYEGDHFEPYEENGVKLVNYRMNVNHTSKIIAAFIRLVRIDGTIDYKWMMESDWLRLKDYSAKKNKSKGANELYSSNGGQIDPGFLEAKLLKHAFRSMPKVTPFGDHTKLPEDPDETIDQEEIATADIYGFNQPAHQAAALPSHQAQPTIQPQQPATAVKQELSDSAKAAIINATATEEPTSETRQFNIPGDDEEEY